MRAGFFSASLFSVLNHCTRVYADGLRRSVGSGTAPQKSRVFTARHGVAFSFVGYLPLSLRWLAFSDRSGWARAGFLALLGGLTCGAGSSAAAVTGGRPSEGSFPLPPAAPGVRGLAVGEGRNPTATTESNAKGSVARAFPCACH